MLDFDLLASPNYARFISTAMATSTASPDQTAQAPSNRSSRDFWKSQGLAYETIPFDHQLGDKLTNINNKGLSEHSDAAVHAILTFAQSESGVNGTDKGSTAATTPKEFKGHHKVR